MGAETTVYARVLKFREEWIEVSAVTLDEAHNEALRQQDVVRVVELTYDRPEQL